MNKGRRGCAASPPSCDVRCDDDSSKQNGEHGMRSDTMGGCVQACRLPHILSDACFALSPRVNAAGRLVSVAHVLPVSSASRTFVVRARIGIGRGREHRSCGYPGLDKWQRLLADDHRLGHERWRYRRVTGSARHGVFHQRKARHDSHHLRSDPQRRREC